jgi:hypothetical protein
MWLNIRLVGNCHRLKLYINTGLHVPHCMASKVAIIFRLRIEKKRERTQFLPNHTTNVTGDDISMSKKAYLALWRGHFSGSRVRTLKMDTSRLTNGVPGGSYVDQWSQIRITLMRSKIRIRIRIKVKS